MPKAPAEPTIPLIEHWVPKGGGESIPTHKTPTLITALPQYPLGAWEKFYNLAEWSQFWPKMGIFGEKSAKNGPNAGVPSEPPIPLIVCWGPKRDRAFYPAEKGPMLITPPQHVHWVPGKSCITFPSGPIEYQAQFGEQCLRRETYESRNSSSIWWTVSRRETYEFWNASSICWTVSRKGNLWIVTKYQG